MIEIQIRNLRPMPAPRPQVNTRTGRAYYPREYGRYVDELRLLIASFCNKRRIRRGIAGLVEVDIVLIGAAETADADNLGKTILDALQDSRKGAGDGVLLNDRQCRRLIVDAVPLVREIPRKDHEILIWIRPYDRDELLESRRLELEEDPA